MKLTSKSPLMTPECTMKTQGSNNGGKETLFVPFALIYNDLANSIYILIQSLIIIIISCRSTLNPTTGCIFGLLAPVARKLVSANQGLNF